MSITQDTAAPVEGEIVENTQGPADTAGEENTSPATVPAPRVEVEVEVEVSELTAKQAKALAERIKKGLTGAADSVEKMNKTVEDAATLMAEAFDKKIWLAMELPDWDAFVAAELGELRLRLERGVRRSLVYRMSDMAHMSTRAIAPVIGVDQKTVSNDLRYVRAELGIEAPAKVAGKDGKVYEGTDAPKPRKVKPLADRFVSALTKAETGVYALIDLADEEGWDEAAPVIGKPGLADVKKMIDLLRSIEKQLEDAGEATEPEAEPEAQATEG